jgi:hypothetical protein
MTQDAMKQRLRGVFQEQQQLTNRNACLNLDSLLARFAARCKELGDHPQRIFEEYMQKYNSR